MKDLLYSRKPGTAGFIIFRLGVTVGIIIGVLLALKGIGLYGNTVLDALNHFLGPQHLANYFREVFGAGRAAFNAIAGVYLVVNLTVVTCISVATSYSIRHAKATKGWHDVEIGKGLAVAFYCFMPFGALAISCATACVFSSTSSNGELLGGAFILLLFVGASALVVHAVEDGEARGHSRSPLRTLRYVTYGPAIALAIASYTPGTIALAAGLVYLMYSAKALSFDVGPY